MGPLPIVTTRDARPRALTIAGSDSGGGAGIQADLKTFTAYGVFAMTAITAITVQNTEGVSDVEEVSPGVVAAQIRSVATDIGVDAAKTGMLSSAAIVEAVADAVAETGIPNLVVDPVFVSKHGNALLAPDAVGALTERILPLATLVTPNLPEAAGLTGIEVATRDDMRRAADALLESGSRAVLVKGGHLHSDGDGGESPDLFADGGRQEWLIVERIDTPNTHGTGCTLSAAIAASLAGGADLLEAVRSGKSFVTESIRHALPLGRGIGPVDQLWQIPPLSGGRA
jgi:hydroxymethylpyrimidine/phosphomethylpyrimidine kinase